MAIIRNYLSKTIEIPVVFALFGLFLQTPVLVNLIVYRTCYINLGFNESDCALLGTGIKNNVTEKLEEMVQPDANTIILLLQLPVGLMSAVVGLFVGSWSDRNGRKPVLIATIGAQAFSVGMTFLFCFFPSLSPWYLFICSIPVIITGGFSGMLSSFLSFVTDISDEHGRGLRLGIFEVFFSIASLAGTLASSVVFKKIGYTGIYLVSMSSMLISLLFIIFILKEQFSETDKETRRLQKQLSFSEQLESMRTSAFRTRPKSGKSLIILCIIITSLFVFALLSDLGIIYLFLQMKFGWSLQKFTLFSSIRDFLSIIGTFIGVYGLHKVLGVGEAVLVVIGLISCFSSSLVQGLASIDVHIYFAGTLRFLSGCVNPMLRSLISKIADPGEIGQIFSVAVMCQTIFQLIGAPLFTEIYNKSISTWPSLYNFFIAAIYFLAIVLSIVVMILRYKTKQDNKYDILGDQASTSTSTRDGYVPISSD